MNEASENDQPECRTNSRWRRRSVWLALIALILAAFAGSLITYVALRGTPWNTAEVSELTPGEISNENEETGIITLEKSKWEIAGIRLEPASRQTLRAVIRMTGKLALNEDRLAQVYPQVEGIVREVPVHFGQEVEAGQTLVVIDSQQIGVVKLDLIKSRLATRLAEVDFQWHQTVETNVQALIESLRKHVTLSEIQETFLDRDMGEYRAQLVSAYARLHKSQADLERLKLLTEQHIAAGKDLLAAQTTLEADQATMQALLEQIKFTSRQNRITALHDLERAKTAESIGVLNLQILGVGETSDLTETVASGGEAVSHYTIASPIAGAIIHKDVVLQERVDPTSQLFSIADLSTVWVRVDVFEQHVPLISNLESNKIRFRANSYPEQIFEGRVFSTGSVVDQQTRSLPLTAVAENPQRLLKPGMFVEVEMQGEPLNDVLVVPTDAIQAHENKQFVFVHLESDRFQLRNITTGRTGDKTIEVTSGLRAGEVVVVQGGFFLKSQLLAEQFADED
jgi:cobalt-zinc-cadmium efflux system membrane fusion protein